MAFSVPTFLVGASISREDAAEEHPLGSRAFGNGGQEYIYVLTSGALTAGAPIKFTAANTVAVSGNAGRIVGVAPHALGSAKYGWVQVGGVVNSDVATSTAAGAGLARVADSNGDFVTVAAGTGASGATCLVVESGGKSLCFLH